MMEDRTRQEPDDARARVVLQNVGARDVGRKEVGRELNAPERQIQRLRERRHEERLREPRHPDEERVAPREERHEHELDHALLPDHANRDRFLELARRLAGSLKEQGVARCRDGRLRGLHGRPEETGESRVSHAGRAVSKDRTGGRDRPSVTPRSTSPSARRAPARLPSPRRPGM